MNRTSDTATSKASEKEQPRADNAQAEEAQAGWRTAGQLPSQAEREAFIGETDPHSDDTPEMIDQPRPNLSNASAEELLPILLAHYNNDRDELGRGLAIEREEIDLWFSGESQPNESTLLRMRRIAMERNLP